MLKYVFLLFTLLFLGITESDVICYLQCCAASHTLPSYPWLSAIILTLITGWIIYIGERIANKLRQDRFAVYAFCAWMITALTSLGFVSIGYQIGLAIVAISITFAVLLVKNKIQRSSASKQRKNTQAFFLQAFTLFLYMGIGNGVTDIQHYELRTAQALMSNHLHRGYKVGEKSYATSQRLFAMRCYLLAKDEDEGGLGEHIFEQVVPQSGAASLFFPKDEKQKLLFPTDSLEHLLGSKRLPQEPPIAYLRRCAWQAYLKGNDRTPIDYYLCGLLLDRNLRVFASEVKRFYPKEVTTSKLPTYFAQALLLYRRTNTQPQLFYTDSSIEANMQDYMDMGDTIANKIVRCNLLRRSYGTTYWWWYAYGVH